MKNVVILVIVEELDENNFQKGTPPGSRPDLAYLIKELDGTWEMANQREAPTDTAELLTRLTWPTLSGLEPATLGSVA